MTYSKQWLTMLSSGTVAAELDLQSVGTAGYDRKGASASERRRQSPAVTTRPPPRRGPKSGRRDLKPRPPEPPGLDLSGEARPRVATTRWSWHRGCESEPGD